ncbi:uncharacterized protein [Nicotiana sylvestris]|uniref:uncharacterized protein n=1 Tax=Nicotiana sylvestris TaxID=4096 RepID=UPI00388C67AA
MVVVWGESSDEKSDDEDGDEQALMAIGESDEESEVSVIHLKDKIKFLSKERLSELLLDFIDEYEVLNNEKEQLSKECVILKAKCKNLELRASESDSKNAELKNQVHELDTTILELRSENLKLKLETSKKKANHTQLTLEENLGKMKDELYKIDEQIRVLKEDLSKVKHELERTYKWNRYSDALSWLYEHHSSNKRGLGYGTPAPKWDPKSPSREQPNMGKRVNNIYIVDLSTHLENELACLSVLDNDPLIRHKRLGHASLSQLNKQGPDEAFDMFASFVRKSQKQLVNQLASIRKFSDNKEELEPKAVYKSEMKPSHKVLFEFVIKCVLPRQERRHIANFMDLVLMECLDSGKHIRLPKFIIQLLDRIINGTKSHVIPYGFILTAVLEHFKVPLKKWEVATNNDYFRAKTLIVCDFEVHATPNEPSSSKKAPVNSKVRALVQESGAKDAEIARLKTRLAEVESERDALRTELAREKEKNVGILQDMLELLQAKNQVPSSSKP